jgi:Holliday junction resolvase RusA-like endonuclease
MSDSVIKISVRGNPQTKGSARAFYRKGMRFPVVTNDNRKCKSWEADIKLMAQLKAPKTLWTGAVILNVRFYLKKPKSAPKRRRLWHTKKPDTDKMLRAIKDALTGVIYKDDSQVVMATPSKDYAENTGVVITAINAEAMDPLELRRILLAGYVSMVDKLLHIDRKDTDTNTQCQQQELRLFA